jgi:hypothetical protein
MKYTLINYTKIQGFLILISSEIGGNKNKYFAISTFLNNFPYSKSALSQENKNDEELLAKTLMSC